MIVPGFSQLKSLLKQDATSYATKRIAVLGDSSTQLLVQAIRGFGISQQLNLEIYEADYDRIELELFDAESGFHQFDADIVVLFQDASKLRNRFYRTAESGRREFAATQLALVDRYFQAVVSARPRTLIYLNFPVVSDGVFGNFGAKVNSSFPFQLHSLNLKLMELALAHGNFHICDLAALTSLVGQQQAVDRRMYANADVTMSLQMLPLVAKQIVDMVKAISGKVRKCLIVDLDNTLWGGVIGDDGLANIQLGDLGMGKTFSELQLWIRQLVDRGIILAVCSKNTEEIAKQPFTNHPDMVLSLDDIAVFVANWNNKPDNIRHIQSILNIGFDSMVFVDDNPFERNIVRENLPDVCVPELPEDPAEFLPYLQQLNLFETATYSENDRRRTQQYQTEAKRAVAQRNFTNEADFLNSLRMVSVVEPFNEFTLPRVAQLCQRSNQFNLRTIRYSEDELRSISQASQYVTRSFSLQDKFGDNGLIGILILEWRDPKELFIDTWIMSCRVLKRTMEQFMLNKMVETARSIGVTRITGAYIPTARNGIVAELFADLGFSKRDSLWELPLNNFSTLTTHVSDQVNDI